MFHLPRNSVKKGDPMRARGKVAELALGFGAGTDGLIRMGAIREGLTQDELQPIVDRWRAASPNIVKLWHHDAAAAKKAIATKQAQPVSKGATYCMDGPFLQLRLPSGRSVRYLRPRMRGRNPAKSPPLCSRCPGGNGTKSRAGTRNTGNSSCSASVKRSRQRAVKVIFV
jgi:DNA polymerase